MESRIKITLLEYEYVATGLLVPSSKYSRLFVA
jgi:hypothetical protein